MVVHFTLRRLAAPRYDHRSSGGPANGIAQSLHARLYGLPDDPSPVPTALDELLQSLATARDGDQQHAVLSQLAEQLRNAAEILQWARNNAHWRQLPAPTWEWLRTATDTARDLADGLDEVGPAFASPRAPATAPAPPAPAARRAPAPAPRR
ncbi:hypothetical protein SAZ_32675 [Streptomyces noursei ZPM]|uniref:Uncharacterized protein n=1 Tax=Streptomyces noursei TaxID=1971 RepID=A0A401R9X5_STRNR|nr:hypothetical protein [Streptomyces noursei]AKA08989.1 hypothetical protein SAZ_32675 [Streptomyces noursei ZPM]EPY92577.1 hypothetical protein K530_52545 [Streptomyces noursei CCRC 11814]EXU92678.1 hypothetical protein P354_15245 [Streptomyces noursei PD-1]UWS75176.1 hypothetical protein N1H47_30415 [Streptomyces noursei]GCB94441.1 hypothetical protein SALB_07240 [Streptomyces noursei]